MKKNGCRYNTTMELKLVFKFLITVHSVYLYPVFAWYKRIVRFLNCSLFSQTKTETLPYAIVKDILILVDSHGIKSNTQDEHNWLS